MPFSLPHAKAIRGSVNVPGDKSISHRSIMLGALASGETRVSHFLPSADCLSTIDCFRKMGVEIQMINDETIVIKGSGINGLKEPSDLLYTGNSGTTTRLMTGILAAQPFNCVVSGDESIRRRPMQRILTPLSMMGASIESAEGGRCPLSVHGAHLTGIRYELPVASAQLKSALLFAGLYADGETQIIESAPSRDHTERMLEAFGANITKIPNGVSVSKTASLTGRELYVPGDISSAAFFAVAAAILPGSDVLLKNVGVNPTRTGIIDVMLKMGADIELVNYKDEWEPIADIRVKYSKLKGCEIGGKDIPRLIDELPILAVLAAFAEGKTVIRDAQELKHKESNRISAMTEELSKAGVDITETDDGMIINGGNKTQGADFVSYGDHRIAMSMAVCALASSGESTLDDADCVNISYPDFFSDLANLSEGR